MTCFICVACGTQFNKSSEPPRACPVCEDDRQFVPQSGQEWTDMAAISRTHSVIWNEEAQGVHSLQVSPDFAIGQRAFLIEGPDGNILWDCLSLVDETSAARIAAMGRPCGNRDFAPSFLFVDGRVEQGLWRRADPSPRR